MVKSQSKVAKKSKKLLPEFKKLLAKMDYFILNNILKQHAEIV